MHTIKITPNLLCEYQCTSGKFIRLPNRIESKNRFGSENRIESKLFCPSWNALLYMCPSHLHRQTRTVLTANNDDRVCPPVRLYGRERISGSTRPIITKFFSCLIFIRGSVLLWLTSCHSTGGEGRIAAATCRIRLRISIARRIFPEDAPKCPFPERPSSTWFLSSPESTPQTASRSVQPF